MVFSSLLTGFVVGVIFQLLRLPIPAPPVIGGVMGIVGIFSGYKVAAIIMEFYKK